MGVPGVGFSACVRNAEFRGCLHTFLETSTHAFPIFSCVSNGVFMFDPLLLFRCFPEVGRFGPYLCHFHSWRWLFPLLGGA
jgi:hypothetical protein